MAGFGVPATRPTVLPGLDGVTRCSWATETGLDLTGYHDSEWGVPTRDEAVLFEALALTYFENGLSWATVFRKRDAFRRAFHHFEPDAVAALTASDVELLMKDASIVRNRAKIEATIHNARLLTACRWPISRGNINRGNTIGCVRGTTAAWTARSPANSPPI